jgi:hypothetical protein
VESEPPLSAEVVDTALTSSDNPVTVQRTSVDELFLADGDSRFDETADVAFADWDELALAL